MIGGQKFLQNHFNILFQYSEDHGRRYTDQYAGCDPAEKEYREVEENPQIFYKSRSYEELSEIVQYTGSHADTDDREETGLLQADHPRQAQECPGKRIEHTEETVKKETGDNDPYHTDACGFLPAELIQRYDCYDVGDTKFDPRDARVVWYNSFNI